MSGRRAMPTPRSCIVGCLVIVVAVAATAPAAAQGSKIDRPALAARLAKEIRDARSSIHVAATDCTFALMSEPLRTKAVDAPVRGRVVVALEQRGRCALPGYQPAPPPYHLIVRRLVPMRVDAERNLVHRREFVLVDRARVLVLLSDAAAPQPSEYYVYAAALDTDRESRELVGRLGPLLWPGFLTTPGGGGELRRDPRWSTANHRALTTQVLSGLGFERPAIAVVEAGNVNVDRLANQFNNPQHSMRDIGQTVDEAKTVAAAWIDSRKQAVQSRVVGGDVCCALFALGEALHTVQDRKHGWIPLYRHLLHETLSDYLNEKEPVEWAVALQETQSVCQEVLQAVGTAGGDAAMKTLTRGEVPPTCLCDGFTVKVSR